VNRCDCGATDFDPDQGCCFECFCAARTLGEPEQFEDRPRCCTCNDALAIKGDGGEYVACPDCQVFGETPANAQMGLPDGPQ
jgi:hypothetical protein